MTQIINVLDHGYVRLIDHMGSDLSIVRHARNLPDAEWREGIERLSDSHLINYLWENKHTSPFEAVTFDFHISCPIFVARQWMRHRTWSYNEMSGRYTVLPENYYIPEIENIGTQHKTNKQCREFNPLDEEMKWRRKSEIQKLQLHCESAFNRYHDLLDSGWPRELARMVLPLNTYTHFFGTVNLLNLLKFITLRNHEHAQYEIMVYAEALEELIELIVPVTIATYRKFKDG